MELYRVSDVSAINSELVMALVQRYKTKEVPRLKRLHDYYLGNPDIKKRKMNDPAKPNNRIFSPYSSYIVDTIQGYFMGKPIAYSSEDKDLMKNIQDIHDKNHESAHNSKMAKELSITGVGYELLYINEAKEVKLALLNPEEVFMIFDNSIEKNAIAAVRTYPVQNYVTNKIEVKVELYTATTIRYATIIGSIFQWHEDEESEHFFKKVPIIQYLNNDEATGDFEKVIDLINAYDLGLSNTANNLDYFSDAYLVLSGMAGTEEEDIANMTENRVMILGEGGNAQFLTKGAQNDEVEAHKDRLKEDIHTLSSIPNLGDASFGAAASGESLKYKLFGLENLVAIKERNFTYALENRLELTSNILNHKGNNFDSTSIALAYTRNIPSNISTTVDLVSKLSGLISKETLLAQLPFIEDPAYELAKMEAESEGTLYEKTFADLETEEIEEELITEEV